jgi:peptidyl-prolyl cis-trans isomerase SurA
MMGKKGMRESVRVLMVFVCLFWVSGAQAEEQYLDGIMAVVEESIILESELARETYAVMQNMPDDNRPPEFIVRKQILDRMVIEKLQLLLAERVGIRITDNILQRAVSDIAARNQLSLDDFRVQLESQRISYQSFVDNVKKEITISQLRGREVASRVKVSEREIDHFMETQSQVGAENIQYHLGHILVALPEQSNAREIKNAKDKADRIIEKLQHGAGFKQTAMTESDGGQALSGGDLGWRSLAQIPSIFVDQTRNLSAGELGQLIRSPSGFHIIKMMDLKGRSKHIITQTQARHILIKLNELINDQEAQKRLLALTERIENGDDFAVLARSHSDDKASALKGGDLGWVSPGYLVPPFEEAMNELAINALSAPVQTQFGWHLIQVLDRQDRDNSKEYKRTRAREQIRQRKIEEETELWLRRLRDEAFVDIRLEKI